MAQPKETTGTWVVCRHEDIYDGKLYLCVRNPGHLGEHSHQLASKTLVAKLASKTTAPLPRRQVTRPRDPATALEDGHLWRDGTTAPSVDLLPDMERRLLDLDDLADRTIENVGMEPGLVDLAVQRFEHEAAQFTATVACLEAELDDRGRLLDFAAAAAAYGHHPAAAYCYAADRYDPAVTS